MKRILSVFLVVFMLTAVMPTTNVFAATAADNIIITTPESSLSFSKMQMGKVNCSISNSGAPVGARVEMYIDGYLQKDAGSPYFVIYQQNNENFDVYIPPILDAGVGHKLDVKFIFDDGSSKMLTVPFTVSAEPVQISAEIVSNPVSVDPGMEIYFWVKLNFSDKRYGYRIRTSVDLNSSHVPAFDHVRTVGDDEVILVTIPSAYTKVDGSKFRFEFNVNSFPGYGESCAYAGVWVPMKGHEDEVAAPAQTPDSAPSPNPGPSDDLIKPVKIQAYVKTDAKAYSTSGLSGYKTTIPAGSYVTYMNPNNHNSMSTAKVQTNDGSIYWVAMKHLMITTGDYVIPDNLSTTQKEAFINSRGYSSKTDYLIWVNLERQILTVFMGRQGSWGYVNTFPVATGKNATPTPTVVHEITGKTTWVTPTYTCSPVLLLYDGYALHNQPVSPSGYVTDTTIGKPASAGCVRMLKKDIDWVNYYCPVGTNVVIY